MNRFTYATQNTPKGQASLLMQIRTGHFPINAYLKRFHRSESAKCDRCDKEADKTVEHFLFTCKAHQDQRRDILKLSTPPPPDTCLSRWMDTKMEMAKLIEFTVATERFNQKEGGGGGIQRG